MRREPQRIGPQERLLLLKRLPNAERLPAEALVPLAQHAVERAFTAGATVIRQADFLRSVFLVAEGRLEVERVDQPTASIGRGDVAGALEVMANAPSAATIRAVEETLLLEIPAGILFDVYEDQFSLFMATIRSIAESILAIDPAPATQAPREASTIKPATDLDDLVQRLLWLRSNTFLEQSRLGSLFRFTAELETVTAAPGTRLWARGDRASWILFLVRGTVTCTLEGSQHLVDGPGLDIGTLDVFAESERRFDADATEELVGLRLGAERLTDILEDDFGLAKDVLAELAGRLLRAEGQRAPVEPASG